jgi:hypothetical protein
MIAIDSSFLLRFLLSQSGPSDDGMKRLEFPIRCDILKLENQIPLFVLTSVLDFAHEALSNADIFNGLLRRCTSCLLSTNMIVTEIKGGRASAALGGKPLVKRGSLCDSKLICKLYWRNKDDFLLVTVRFITVRFLSTCFSFFSDMLNLFGLHFICSLLTVDIVFTILFISSTFSHDCITFRFLLTDVLRYTLVRPLL